MYEFRTAPSKANGVRQSRLLIGESNPTMREYLLAILRADGHEVVAMGSGIDLLDTLAVSLHPEFGSGYFDLVIAEARMLGAEEARLFSGFRNRTKIPPFVFTTVCGDQELQAKARQFSALAVLEKPLELDDLRQIVNRSLGHLTADFASLPHVPQPALVAPTMASPLLYARTEPALTTAARSTSLLA
jgi:DNA-binding NtrC family response regulator